MPAYIFIAKDKDGNKVKEPLEAISRYEAMSAIKSRGLTLISISPDKAKRAAYANVQALKNKRLGLRLFAKPVSIAELAIFCRQFSLMFDSGIDLIKGLESIAEDMDNLEFKRVLLEIADDIKNGAHFSEALDKHKNIFEPVFVALVRSAEEAGSMDDVFRYMASHFEKLDRLTRKMKSIMTYPIFVSIFFMIVVFIMTVFILPRFEALFAGFGKKLPFITQTIFSVNRFFLANFPIFLLAIFGFACFLVIYRKTPAGRYNLDKIKLELPLLGKLIRKSAVARFCRILSMMTYGGVPIGMALEITAKTCGNKVLERSVDIIKDKVINGAEIAGSLAKDENFPRLMVRMVSIGESSGKLPEVLDKVSDIYEDQLESTMTVIASLFEPIAIIIFGGVILLLILAIYVPVFKFASTMRG